MVLDHVGGQLAAADGSPDEGVDEVLAVVEHEPIAGLGRDGREGGEGVGALVASVVREPLDGPVPGEEEFPVAGPPGRVEPVGDMGLVDDGPRHRTEAVPELSPGRGVRPHRLHRGDGGSRWSAGAHDLEGAPGGAGLQPEVGQEQVLVEVAGHQLLPQPPLVEEFLPGGDLGRLDGSQRHLPGFQPGSLRYPSLQGGVLGVREGGDQERHSLLGVLLRPAVEVLAPGAVAGAVDPGLDRVRDGTIGTHGVPAAQRQHPRQERVGPALEDRLEAPGAPGGGVGGVEVELGRLLVAEAGTRVDHLLAGSPVESGLILHLQLAGGVVAGVAGQAVAFQDGADVAQVVHPGHGRDLGGSRRGATRGGTGGT